MNIVANSINKIFHPFLLPTYAVIATIWCSPFYFGSIADKANVAMIGMVFINLFFFPMFTLFLMKKLNLVQTEMLNARQQKFIPYIATLIFYVWASVAAYKSGMPFLVSALVIGFTISLVLQFFINIFSETSTHASAVGCLVAFAGILTYFGAYHALAIICCSILIAGLVGFAQVQAHQRSLSGLAGGFFIGFASMFFALRFVL